MKITKFDPDEYQKFSKKLNKFSLHKLKYIANKTGLKFTNNKNLSKKDIIFCLDESDKNELLTAYWELISQK